MDTTQQEIAARQALAQALLQKGMSGGPQGQMISGHYVGPGLGALVPLAQAIAGQKIGQEANTQAKSYEDTQREALRNDLAKFLTTHRGAPGEAMGPPTEEGGMGVTGAVPADPQAAILGAMTSRHPEMQKIGQSQLATLLGPKTPEHFGNPVTERGSNGDLISVQYGNLGNRRVVPGAVPFEKPMAVADRVIDPAKPTAPLADYSTKGGETKTVNGDLYQVDSNGIWHKLDNAPKINVAPNISVNTAEDAYLRERGKGVATTAHSVQESARAATGVLRSVAQLRELDKAGTFSNPTAGAATFMSQVGQSLGFPVDSAKMAGSESYRAEVRNLLIAQMQQLGGAKGLSEKETQLVLEAFPNLDRSPQARATIFNILEGKAKQAQGEYQTLLNEERKRYPSQGMMGYDFSEMGAGGAAPGSVPVVPPAAAPGSGTIKKSGW